MPLVGRFEAQDIEFHQVGVRAQGKRIPFSFIMDGGLSLAGLPLFTLNPALLMNLSLEEMGRIKNAIMEMAARRIKEEEIRRIDLFERRMLSFGPPKTMSAEQFAKLVPIVYEINAVCSGKIDRVKYVLDEWEKNVVENKKDPYSTLLVILEEEFYTTGGFEKIGKVGGAGAIVGIGAEKPPTKVAVPLERGTQREWEGMPLLRAETQAAERNELAKLITNARKMPNTKVVSLREMLRYHFERYPAEYQDVLRVLFALSDNQLADPAVVEAMVAEEVERLGAFGFSHLVYTVLMANWKRKNEKEKLEKFGCMYDPVSGQFIICSLCATLKGIASMLLSKLKGG